jgi:hypothetical protein
MMDATEGTASFATNSDIDKVYRFIFPIGTVITGPLPPAIMAPLSLPLTESAS